MAKTGQTRIMNKLIFILILCTLMAGCSATTGIFGKSSKAVDKQANRIEAVESKLNSANVHRLQEIGTFSYGIDLTLRNTHYTNQLYSIGQLNDRILSLAETPDLAAKQEMQRIVADLESNHNRLLQSKDAEIKSLQTDITLLQSQKEVEVKKALDLSVNVASQADASQAALNEYKQWFGLKGILLGAKQFLTTSLWVILGFSFVYLILRVFAATNPFVGALFQIFNVIGGVFIRIIQSFAPQAAQEAGHVADIYRDTLERVVDVLQTTKTETQKAELAASLNDDHKAVVDGIKKKLLY